MERQENPANDPLKTPVSAANSAVSPSADGADEAPDEKKQIGGVGDFITMAILAVVFLGVLYYWASGSLDVFAVLKVVLGLSFVIFIHEFGHFAVAKMCDVHVTHFSIGFGPVIPGCSFQWGETKYQICLLPLGGYVQMVGQVDGDESSDGSENDPRSFRNKSVGQRMAIISAGVIMNVIFAFVCFVAIYRGPGRDLEAAIISATDTDGPAFVNGIRSGMRIDQIGDDKDPFYENLRLQVIGSYAGEKIKLVAELPGEKKPLDIEIEPRKSKDDKNPVLGVQSSKSAKLVTAREMPTSKTPTIPFTPAFAADFKFGDVIVATSDPDAKVSQKQARPVTPLPPDPFNKDQKNYFEFYRRMLRLAGEEVTVVVQRTENETTREVEVKVAPAFRSALGASMKMGQIVSIRKGSPADDAKLQIPEQGKNLAIGGDVIEKVEVPDPDDLSKTIVFEGATLDPERLPFQLKEWAQKLVENGKMTPEIKVTLHVLRHRKQAGEQFEKIPVQLGWDNSWSSARTVPLSPSSPVAIPELGLGYQVKTEVAHASKDSKLAAGDIIKNARITFKDPDGKSKPGSWAPEDFRFEGWAHVSFVFLDYPSERIEKIELKVKHKDKDAIEEIEIVPTKAWPMVDRGWVLAGDMRKQRTDSTLEAIGMGLQSTKRNVLGVLNYLRQVIASRLSLSHVGGPIMIAQVAYHVAGYDFLEFLFLLAMISVNLAVVNFLPIPVLDGGHMVFLVYEKLRGKPPTEGVRIAATYVGLALIATIFLIVNYNDVARLLS